jgi:hypothetical protein
MIDMIFPNVKDVNRYWSQVVTSMVWGQWQMIDAGFRATSKVLEAASQPPAPEQVAPGSPPHMAGPDLSAPVEELVQRARNRLAKGLAPPPEIYRAPYRERIDWSKFPEWAKPSDPEVYEGCGHEG